MHRERTHRTQRDHQDWSSALRSKEEEYGDGRAVEDQRGSRGRRIILARPIPVKTKLLLQAATTNQSTPNQPLL